MSSEGRATDEASQSNPAPTKDSKDTLQVEVNGDYRQLFEAAVKGDWKAAEEILNKDSKAMTAKVMTVKETSLVVLEVAVMAAQDQFVENLIEYLPREFDVGIFKTALDKAAMRGRPRMIKALLDKVDAYPQSVLDALHYVVCNAHLQKEIIWYLARRTTTTSVPHFTTIVGLLVAGHMDICLYLARRCPSLVTLALKEDRTILAGLARLKSYFRDGTRLNFWEKCIYQCIPLCLVDTSFDISNDTKMARALMRFKISLWSLATKLAPIIKRIGESKLRHTNSLEFANLILLQKKKHMKAPELLHYTSHIVLQAASQGISEIVKLCLRNFPELMWDENFTKELIKEVVHGRHVELFRLVNGHLNNLMLMEGLSEYMTEWSPRCVSRDVSGAAFLMQRELQWFKVLQDRNFACFLGMSRPGHPFDEKFGFSFWEAFVKKREDLLKLAGQWMKDTSSSCSLVSTLIITVAFAAAFTVPGGNDSIRGIPIFLKKGSFMVVAIADALALFSSITATLMFLAILTSRYAIEDFLLSLPRKMILGLTFLFLSLAFMLVAFSSALTIVLSERLKWIYIPITLLAAFPIVLFAILQLPLYVEMVESTYWPRLYRPLKIWK